MADIIDFTEYRKRKTLRRLKPRRRKIRKKRLLKPDRQGRHDGLCGVYVIVNALKAIHRFSEDDRERIFNRLIDVLERDNAAGGAITRGTTKAQMDAMIAEAIAYVEQRHKLRVSVTPLFRRGQNVSVKSFWRALRRFLEEHKRASVIIGTRGRHYHWTCVRAMSRRSMRLLDSSGGKHIWRRSCRMGKPTANHYHLLPTQVWGFSLD